MSPQIVFLHFPKTAGTTYSHVLEGAVTSRRHTDQWHQLDAMPDQGQELLDGHLLYEQIAPYRDDAFFLTLLRHPIERTISFYQYVRRRPDHQDHQLAMDLSLDEFAQRGAGSQQYLTQLTAHIDRSGDHPRVGFDGSVKDRFEVAKERLGAFDHIGITERMDEAVALLARQLDWTDVPSVPQMNVSAKRSTRADLAPSTIDAILHRAWPDVALYELGLEHFERQLTSEEPRPN